MTELEELKAALEAATPGRWAYDDDGFVYGDMDDTQPTGGGYIVSDPHSSPEADIDEREGNGKFITLAHNLMPTLLEAVEAAQNLVAMKGRYNTEIAYGRLEQTLEKLK